MHSAIVTITLLLGLSLLPPISAQASWWGGGDDRRDLNLELGYDANTVITVSGRIVTLPEPAQSQLQAVIEANSGRINVVLGPRGYWQEHGFELKIGDEVKVRGSKAQGKDGKIYLLAQTVSESSRGQEVALRSDGGKPVWDSNSMGSHMVRNTGRVGHLAQQPAMRMGGGGMGH